MATENNGLVFKTQLEARWAAFFDLAGWGWWANPATVGNWRPDFKVSFHCTHSECAGQHTLLVAVLPVSDLEALRGHPSLGHAYGVKDSAGVYIADAGAAFGDSPAVSSWVMSHGAGGGNTDVPFWVENSDELWARAGAATDSAS